MGQQWPFCAPSAKKLLTCQSTPFNTHEGRDYNSYSAERWILYAGAAPRQGGLLKDRIIWGADPGITGAVCALHIHGTRITAVHVATPEVERFVSETTKRTNSRINVGQFLRACKRLAETSPPDLMVLERVYGFPGQSSNAVFSFGHAAGVFEAALANAYACPILRAMPHDWKMFFGITNPGGDRAEKKKKAVKLANRVLEELSDGVRKPFKMKEDGIAEAMLLACYGDKEIAQKVQKLNQAAR